jgi:ATP-binding cassette subfamily F protein uup
MAVEAKTAERKKPAAAAIVASVPKQKPKPRKLGFKQARELEQLPATIESLESQQSGLVAQLSEPDFYKNDAAEQARVHARLATLVEELEVAYARWSELEALRDGT